MHLDLEVWSLVVAVPDCRRYLLSEESALVTTVAFQTSAQTFHFVTPQATSTLDDDYFPHQSASSLLVRWCISLLQSLCLYCRQEVVLLFRPRERPSLLSVV